MTQVQAASINQEPVVRRGKRVDDTTQIRQFREEAPVSGPILDFHPQQQLSGESPEPQSSSRFKEPPRDLFPRKIAQEAAEQKVGEKQEQVTDFDSEEEYESELAPSEVFDPLLEDK